MNGPWLKADARHPDMGLNNTPCVNPKYWCRLHQVWLSESDAENKKCRCRPTIDMISVRQCNNLEQKDYKTWKNLIS